MWIPFSTPSPARSRPNRLASILGTGLAAVSLLASSPAPAQQVVFDPRNHIENALQAARQLESLANEARSLAASPYSHLTQSSQSLRDMAELARTARGIASSVSGLEQQFRNLYPEDLSGSDMLSLLEQGQARTANARRTAEDVAGQTAAVQSSNQLLAVLAEDLAALRTIMLAQSRLLAEATARDAADRASGDAARRQRWGRQAAAPTAPRFNPLSHAQD